MCVCVCVCVYHAAIQQRLLYPPPKHDKLLLPTIRVAVAIPVHKTCDVCVCVCARARMRARIAHPRRRRLQDKSILQDFYYIYRTS